MPFGTKIPKLSRWVDTTYGFQPTTTPWKGNITSTQRHHLGKKMRMHKTAHSCKWLTFNLVFRHKYKSMYWNCGVMRLKKDIIFCLVRIGKAGAFLLICTVGNADAYKQIGQWDFVEIGLYCLCNRYNFDIARRYAEHPDCQTSHYG